MCLNFVNRLELIVPIASITCASIIIITNVSEDSMIRSVRFGFPPLIVSLDSFSPWTLARFKMGGAQLTLTNVT